MRNVLASVFLVFIIGCGSELQNTGGSTMADNTGETVSRSDLVGEWQYAGIHGESADKRIPGFLKEHGYIFSDDGNWKSRHKPLGGSILSGTYTLNDDKLVMTGKGIIGGSGASNVMLDNGNLILLSDITIRGGDDQPARTRYKKVR